MGLFTATRVDTEPAARHRQERQRRERFATQSGWQELRRADLRFDRFSIVHTPGGDQFKLYRGTIDDGPTHPCSAYFHTPTGGVEFLELVRKGQP